MEFPRVRQRTPGQPAGDGVYPNLDDLVRLRFKAQGDGGVIVNADALQVYQCWRVLTARPDEGETARAPHALYGHVAKSQAYSVGHWLRDMSELLQSREQRPIIVGGTGLYFWALTEGLTEIPEIPAEVRAEGDRVRKNDAEALFSALDKDTAARIDRMNPMRVQRAWEVLTATGRGLASWQDETPAPLLRTKDTYPIVFDCDREWLNDRIERRFDLMLASGALDEVRSNLQDWDEAAPWARAIGAPELVAHLTRDVDLETAREKAVIASRQYAKRQRTWFRNRMKHWQPYSPG